MGTSPVFWRRRWFSLDRVVTYTIALVSIGIAVYVGWFRPEPQRQPQLAIAAQPILVYDPEVTEAFRLDPNREKIVWQQSESTETHKVWAINLAIWNNGALPIKPEHILPPNQGRLVVEIGSFEFPPSVIWELRTLSWSRRVVNFSVATNDAMLIDGTRVSISIGFDILEKDDGARLQLIYSGPRETPIVLRGTIEGLPNQEQFLPTRKFNPRAFVALTPWLPAFIFALGLVLVRRRQFKSRESFRWAIGVVAMLATLTFLTGVLIILTGEHYKLAEIPVFDFVPPTR